ncbi:hypothetical protein HXX76_013192 [Chlamydomonas incerta]|uniref:Uncharacterized protein n=1 Tax=Chlamydomonas incerta TaxID=51695 RepID=A0A835SIK7_CHLIN|nr:hypothetical protein HXX76_013192 [Chlamydomonas incerta]|eukprot:KAG2426211.1 hypothetical protein HXX76_013192 [Chlamydomonas incerta]
MFGYFDKSPWSPDGHLFLAHRIPTFNTSLTPGDGMQLILLDWEQACKTGQPERHWRWLTNSNAWNHQQGAMAQWLGPRSDALIFNDRGAGCRTEPRSGGGGGGAAPAGVPDEDTTCSVVIDVATGNRTAVYGMPIYSINYEGSLGLAINQTAMYRVLKGFGHVTPHPVPPTELLPCSGTDGIWLLDLSPSAAGGSSSSGAGSSNDASSGSSSEPPAPAPPRLLVSLRRAWEAGVAAERVDAVTGQRYSEVVEAGEVEAILTECNHWINTPQFSKEGEYVGFIYRFGACRGKARPWFWRSFQFLYHMRTGELWRVPLVQVSHQDWGWGGTFLVSDNTGYWQVRWKQSVLRWEPPQPRPWAGGFTASWAQQLQQGAAGAAAPERLGDGHASYGPGAGLRFVLSDTYPHKSGRTLFITDTLANASELLGRFDRFNEGSAVGDHRVDLHPRWDRTGRHVCFDSTHEGSRQVYVARTASVPRLATHPGALLPRRGGAAAGGGGGGGPGGGGLLASRRVVVFGARHDGFVGGLVAALEQQALAQYTRLHVIDHRAHASARLSDAAGGHSSKEARAARGLFSLEQLRSAAWVADDPALDLCGLRGAGPGAGQGAEAAAAAAAAAAGSGAAGRGRRRRRSRALQAGGGRRGGGGGGGDGGGGGADGGGGLGLTSGPAPWLAAGLDRRRRLTAGGGGGGGGGGLAEACRAGPVLVRALDAGAWLAAAAYQEEWVECYFDGSSRTPDVLTHMVLDGSIALCDKVDIAEPHAAAAGDAAAAAALGARRAWRESALADLRGVGIAC